MAIGEFELIARYFSAIGSARQIDLGIGDDCALLTPPAGHQLALSIDTLVADVHFPANADPYLIAQKALRTNLSDLAAVGAQPLAFTLALTLSNADENWLAAFSRGLRDCANEFDIALIGGDTTRGPTIVISIQITGIVPTHQALLRSGARVDDAIFVSGTLGDARAALQSLAVTSSQLNAQQQFLLSRYYTPSPRIALGIALRDIATAAIDISDGLAADLGHILERSAVGAIIEPEKLLLSVALRNRADAIDLALHGGDDYELCFTVPQTKKNMMQNIAHQLALPLTEIGTIVAGDELFARATNGRTQPLPRSGYSHF
ncbi:MAG TPA: thiamine-phosphate kinase [Spongiibacteraceae bacterium]